MAKRKKDPRINSSMLEQMSEHLCELKAIASSPDTQDLDMERWCRSLLRSCLGFTASNEYAIRAQEIRGKSRTTLTLLKGDQPVCVVEMKTLGLDLNQSDLRQSKIQLGEYLRSLGNVRWGMITSGYEWKLFDFSAPEPSGIEISSLDLRNEEKQIDTERKTVEEICCKFFAFHELNLSSGAWAESSRNTTAFSPESLARAILSPDALKLTTRIIRGDSDYKANAELLHERIFELLCFGLKEAVPSWNQAKTAELKEWVNSQRSEGKRKRNKQASKKSPTPSRQLQTSVSGTSAEGIAEEIHDEATDLDSKAAV